MSDTSPIVDLHARDFKQGAQSALANETLSGALDHVTAQFTKLRSAAVDAMPEWEELRTRAQEIKAHTLANLDRYLEQFVEQAERNGAQVHFARDRHEACEFVANFADQIDARTIVKSKSMVTEELGINDVLEERGMKPVETDLGEWIIQLADEKPSHIIVPAIHRTRGQIADLFADELGTPRTDDVNELTAIARRFLRKSFAEADLGISGVNFLVAETGSFLVLENEGNARMSTSLPRVHLAVTGIEKVIPRLSDLEVFLRLLPRSGTGQHLTSYQSIFTGPKHRAEDEGPEELHILLVDNGRSAQLTDPLKRESLACIRCGACLNACPVYKHVGGHAYGSVYPGPIGAVITPEFAGLERAGNLPYASSLCGACRDVCPVKINLPELLLRLRAESVADPRTGEGKLAERLAFRAWSWVVSSPARFELFSSFSRPFSRLAAGSGLAGRAVRRLAPPLAAWAAGRELRPAAARPFRRLWREGLQDEVQERR